MTARPGYLDRWFTGRDRCDRFVPKPSSRVSVLGNPVSNLGLSVRQRPLVCVVIVTQLVTQPSLRARRWPVRQRASSGQCSRLGVKDYAA